MTTIDIDAGAVEQTGKSLDETASAYRAHGAVILRNFFDAEAIENLIREADRLLAEFHAGRVEKHRVGFRPTVSGTNTFERFDPVCDIAPEFAEIARNPRLMALVQALIGGEPFLLKDKLIYKLPGDKGYGLHQDYPYFFAEDAPAERFVSVAITIDSLAQEDGGLRLVLDRHDRIQPAPEDNPKDCDPAAVADAPEWNSSVGAGSVIAFHTLTPHSSGPNKSQRTRRMLYLTYTVTEAGYLRDEYYRVRVANKVGQLS